jgi:hypothetical protein
MKALKKNFKNLMSEKLLLRDFSFKPSRDDVMLVSYPRSGNTWMRLMLGHILTGGSEISFPDGIDDLIIDIYKRNNREISRLNRGKGVFKSHGYFNPAFSKSKVIYIVRDPRDVVISYYNYQVKRWGWRELELTEYIDLFICDGVDDYGTWAENAGSWFGAMNGQKNFLILRYEDILRETEESLNKVCRFVGLDVSSTQIGQAVEACSFGAVSRLEKSSEAGRENSSESFFRSGRAEQWREELSIEQQYKFIQSWAKPMSLFGYS